MSLRSDWNVDKYKNEFESYKRWTFRKYIMIAIKDQFPEERVVCLARLLANIRFLGCKYPDSVMKVIQEICDKTDIEIGPLETKNWCEKPKKESDESELSVESSESLNSDVGECTTYPKHTVVTGSGNSSPQLRSPKCDGSNGTELRTTHPKQSKAQGRNVFNLKKSIRQQKKDQWGAHQRSIIQILEGKGIITHEVSQLAERIISQESSTEQVGCNQSRPLNQDVASALEQTVATDTNNSNIALAVVTNSDLPFYSGILARTAVTPEHSELSVVKTEPSEVPDSSTLIPSTSAGLCSLMKEEDILVESEVEKDEEGGVERANSLPLVSLDWGIPCNIFGSLHRTTKKLKKVFRFQLEMFPQCEKIYNPSKQTNAPAHIKSTIEFINNNNNNNNNAKSYFVDCEDEVKKILLFHEEESVPEPEKTTSKDEKKLNAMAETLHKHTIALCKVISDNEKLKYPASQDCTVEMARVVKPCNQLVILWEDGEHPLRTLYRVTMVWRKKKLKVQSSEEYSSVWKTTVSFDGDTVRAGAVSKCKSASLFAASYYVLWRLQQHYYTIIVKVGYALENEHVPAKPGEERRCPAPNKKRKEDPVRMHFILSSENTDERQEKEVTEEREKAKIKCRGQPLNTEMNVGAKMLRMMGWSGSGLGKYGQGMKEPIGSSDYNPFERLGFGILEERLAQRRNSYDRYIEFCKEKREEERKEKEINETEKKRVVGNRIETQIQQLQNDLQMIKNKIPTTIDKNNIRIIRSPRDTKRVKYAKTLARRINNLQKLEAMNIRNDDQMVINKKLIHEYAMTATPTSNDLLLPSKVAPIEKAELMLFAMQLGLNCRVMFLRTGSITSYFKSLSSSFAVTKKNLRETPALVQPWFLIDSLMNEFEDFHCNVVLPGVPLLKFEDAKFVPT